MADTSRLYFRQILAGMDIAEDDPVAQQMGNFVYLIGDRETGDAVVIDPAYDPQAILDLLDADGMRLTGALGTHYHADHVGGSLMGHAVTGIAEVVTCPTPACGSSAGGCVPACPWPRRAR